MTVYVEYVIIDNFIFDYLLLLLTFKKDENVKKSRIFFSAFFGTVIAVIFPFLKFHELVLFVLKIILAFSMVALACNFTFFKDYIKRVIKFVLLTFSFGGIIYGLFSLVGIDYNFLYGTTNSIVPLGVLITLAISLYKLFEWLFNKLFIKKLIYPFVCKCTLKNKGQKITVSALLDSGNHLVYNQKGVLIASDKLAKNLFLQGVISGGGSDKMQINTVAGKGFIKIYEIDFAEIYFNGKKHIINKVKLGITNESLVLSENYDLILSPLVLFE